jgi:hypothetical protein
LEETMTHPLTQQLEQEGVVVVHDLLRPDQLRAMQQAFAGRLEHLRWNDVDGYEKTEPYRHMVQDLLALEQGFVDLALHPTVKTVLREYIGENVALVEAKGWKSLPTSRDFHGWHGDAWYDQQKVTTIPREVKLALYLTDVKTGAFHYLRGSHGKQHPHLLRKEESASIPEDRVLACTGPAGTAILFDTTGIHRQGFPILEPRQALFYNYHDPSIPLQQEDVEYYRYHPLLLNAAFLGGLTPEDVRILGFGDKTTYTPAFARKSPHTWFQAFMSGAFSGKLRLGEFRRRVTTKLLRMVGLA